MPFPDDDLALPQGSLVLVTGVTGYLASVVADELVKKGYRVRGTVRNAKSDKASWLPGYFEKNYGRGKFEMLEIPNLAVEGSLNEAVKGCDAIAHLAANLYFSPDPNLVIPDTLAFTRNALEAALTEPKIQRFVFCSSAAAAFQHRFNEVFDLTPEAWNTKDPAIAWAPPPYTAERTMSVYATSKVEAEQYFWKFMAERKPHFVGNAVLPDMVIGLPVNAAKQGLGPAGTLMQSLWDGTDIWAWFPPQQYVDVKDVALLHVAGLVKGDVQGERLFGYAGNWAWSDILKLVETWYPEHKFPAPLENENKDLSNVTGRPRAEEALEWLGENGWTSIEHGLRPMFDAIRDESSFVSHVL